MAVTSYRCGRCMSVEFSRLETLDIDSNGKLVQGVERGVFKCANCGQKINVAEDGSITVDDSTPVAPVAARPRVRSSVSADERGMRDRGPRGEVGP